MRSPLTGHLFLLFRGSLPQRRQRRLVPAAEVHLCSRHEGKVLDLTAQLRLLFAREEHEVPVRPRGDALLRGLLAAQLPLVGRAGLELGLLGAELGAFAP